MISFSALSCPTEENEINFLYKLLKSRKHSISHSKLPSLKEHRSFVQNHPYRTWCIILWKNVEIGPIYTGFDNSVGIHILQEYISYRQLVILKFLEDFVPLRSIKSKIRKEFIFNVAVNDFEYERDLQICGAIPIQITYSIEKQNISDHVD